MGGRGQLLEDEGRTPGTEEDRGEVRAVPRVSVDGSARKG